jgi:hypothetical protein
MASDGPFLALQRERLFGEGASDGRELIREFIETLAGASGWFPPVPLSRDALEMAHQLAIEVLKRAKMFFDILDAIGPGLVGL